MPRPLLAAATAGLTALLLGSVPVAIAQQTPRLPLSALNEELASYAFESPTTAHQAPALKELPRTILHDQRFLWLRPLRMRRSDLPWAGAIFATTAGLLAIDRPVGQELSDSPPGAGFAFSHRVGQLGGAFTDFGLAGAFYLVGRWRGDERARTTGLLGWRAVADSLIVVEILKVATQRPRPTRDDGRSRNHNADGEFFTSGRSFPSGHAAGAWALATVVAHQYRHRRWVPPTTYSLAALVAVSRVTERKHFPADVFVGSVLGYLIARHVVHSASPASPELQSRWILLPSAGPRGEVGLTLLLQF